MNNRCTDTAKDKYIRMPVAELTTPKGGRLVYADRWWAVTEDEHVLFYKAYTSPQCNDNRAIVDRIKPAGTTARFIPVAYVPHDCHDYCG